MKVLHIAYLNQGFEDKPDFLKKFTNNDKSVSVRKKFVHFTRYLLYISVCFKEMVLQIFKERKNRIIQFIMQEGGEESRVFI